MDVEIKAFVGWLRASIYVERTFVSVWASEHHFIQRTETLERVTCWRWQVGREMARLERKWEQ